MKKIFTLFLFLLCFNGFAQTISSDDWYKILAGNIDRHAITMHLHKAGNHYLGFYYYNNRQQPWYFFGEGAADSAAIRLSSYNGREREETFTFSISGTVARGTWKRSAGSRPLSFMALEIKAPVACTYIFTNGSVKLNPGRENSPEALFEAGSVWPEGASAADACLKEVIRKAFTACYDKNEEIASLFSREKKAYFARSLYGKRESRSFASKSAGTPRNRAVSNRMVFAYQSAKLATLAGIHYTYNEGARDEGGRGHYGITYKVVDLVNKKTLALPDIVNARGQEALVPLLEKYFREGYNLTARDSLQAGGLYENSICLTNNFLVTGRGIGFHYQPYEIGPYALGEITVFVPFKELEPYLTPAFKSLL